MPVISGQVFDRLTVLHFDYKSDSNKYFWKCKCICGNFVSYRSDALLLGRRKSCGCIKSPKKEEYLKRLEKRLFKHSKRNGECLEWKGRCNPFGYGLIKLRSKDMQGIGFSTGTHRAAYLVWKGDIPENMCVLHKCDNKCCIEPSHLFLGSHQDNMDDMKAKSRQNKRPGEKHHITKFSDKDVIEIRKLWDSGEFTQSYFCRIYNVSSACICNMINRKTWKHI